MVSPEELLLLNQRMHRFGELRVTVPGIHQHMLTAKLRELEADGPVKRTIYPEVPPRVEYEITAKARRCSKRSSNGQNHKPLKPRES